MTRVRIVALLLALSPALAAADSMKDALSAIPEEAVGFVCIPSIKDLDARIKGTLGKLELSGAVPPPMASLAGLLRTYFSMSAGLNEEGPLIILQMGGDSPAVLANRQAAIVPASDPAALLQSMGAKEGTDGEWTLTVMGTPAFAAAGDKRVVLGRAAGVAKSVLLVKGGIAAKLKKEELEAVQDQHLVAWADGDRLIKLFRQQIEMMTGMLAMAGGGNAAAARQMESAKKDIEVLVDGTRAVLIALSLNDKGLGLRFGFAAKSGSELAGRMSVRNSSEPLLTGLPGGDYIVAAAQTFDPAQIREVLDTVDQLLLLTEGEESLDQEQVRNIKSLLGEWFPLWKVVRMSVRALPSGPEGMLGVEMIIGTSDSTKWLEILGKLIDSGKQLSSEEEFKKLTEGVAYRRDAEEIGGAKVHHLLVDPVKMEEADEEEMETVTKIAGREGLLLRFTATDDNHVLVSFGGGSERAGRLIQQARGGASALEEQPGIKSASASLPKDRYLVAYFAVDRGLRLGNDIAAALDEEPLPFPVPELNAPIAMTGTGGPEWGQGDVFFPMEFIVATKNAVMTMMTGAGAPSGAESPPAATTQPAD